MYYDAAGSVVGEGLFTRGDGVQKNYYDNGNLRQLTHYKKNRKHGEEVFYKPDGTTDFINKFEDGKLLEKIIK